MNEEQQQKFRNAISGMVRNAHCATTALDDTGNLLRIYLEPFEDAFRDAVRMCVNEEIADEQKELQRIRIRQADAMAKGLRACVDEPEPPEDPRLACLAEVLLQVRGSQQLNTTKGVPSTCACKAEVYKAVFDIIDMLTKDLKAGQGRTGLGQ